MDPRQLARRMAAVIAVVLLVASGFVATRAGKPGPSTAFSASPSPSPSLLVSPTPTDDPLLPTPDVSTLSPSPKPTPSASLTPNASCRNSRSASCGTFSWSPAAGSNAQLTLELEYSPVSPEVGEQVTFTVTADDPDAQIADLQAEFGDGSGRRVSGCDPGPRYGPWTPPARKKGHTVATFVHTYTKKGHYTAVFSAVTGSCGSPYRNLGTVEAPMDVTTPPPSPTPSPSSGSPF